MLGGGFNHIYPKENEWLFHKILENGGCIISEYSPEVKPDKSKFPIRNRIISGLSDGVLVVEAAYRSGSSITAKYALAQGKNVFAIPNNIYENNGIGTNMLIQEGAILVTKPKQIIEKICINEDKYIDSKNSINENNQEEDKNIIIPKEFLQIYKIVTNVPIHINDIANKLNKSIKEINSIITMMELEGYVYQVEPNYFIRKEEYIEI